MQSFRRSELLRAAQDSLLTAAPVEGIVWRTLMSRRLATLVLLLPLFFNGLWMVCADGTSADSKGNETVASKAGDAVPICDGKMCPLQKTGSTSSICLFSATGNGSAIAAFMFAVAAPPAAERISRNIVIRETIREQRTFYTNPVLDGSTPPPKA